MLPQAGYQHRTTEPCCVFGATWPTAAETGGVGVIPHCAIARYGDDIQTAWKFTILKTETPLGEAVNWQKANGAGDTVLKITEKYIWLSLQHFTGEAVVGQQEGTDAQKAVQLLFYSKEKHQLGHKYMVTFHCVDDTLLQVW